MKQTSAGHFCVLLLHWHKPARVSKAGIPSGFRSGFSLFEVLVVMAFLAVVAGIVTINFDKIIPAVEQKPLDRVFIESMQNARILAATSGNEVYLSFEPQQEAFVLEERKRVAPEVNEDEEYDPLSPAASSQQSYAFDKAGETEVLFYKRLSRSSDLGPSGEEYSSDPISHLVFHPSGASTPARVVIRQRGLDDIEVELDAFSSGPIAKEGY